MMRLLSMILFIITMHLNANAQTGPWQSPLKIAYSTDGTNFNNHQIFQDSSGVPSLAMDSNGVLICAFQWFPAPFQGQYWDSIAVKFSYDNGINWTNPFHCIFSGMPANFKRPFDPTIVYTDNGQYRMYFSSGPSGTMTLDTSVNTYSAVSSDGIHYTFEIGARYDDNTRPVIDPAVVKFNGIWHYTAPRGAPQDGAFHCTSANGINFTPLSNINSDATHNWTGNLMTDNNVMRFYGGGQNIWFSTTSDGNNWSGYNLTNVNNGGDPAVFKVANNNYIMVYVGAPSTNIEEANVINFSVFPNPATDKIYIKSKPNTLIKIYNSIGSNIMVEELKKENSEINITNLPVGIYYIITESDEDRFVSRIIKK